MNKRQTAVLFSVFMLAAPFLFGAGSAESASTTSRGDYVAGQGRLIPSSEVYIDSYLSQIDFNYPDSGDPVTVHLYPSSRLLSASGDELWLQVGLQGKRTEFEALSPLYLLLVVDVSGSMSERNKLDWVKRSVDVLLSKLRSVDGVAIVAFSDQANVVVEKTKLASSSSREEVQKTVDALAAFGASSSSNAIDLAYQTMARTSVPGEIRRILFLSDGLGLNKETIDVAKRHFELSRTPLTTVGYGNDFNLADMTELARTCSGSSRFISDREKMQQEFSSDLDRMVVSVARDVDVELRVPAPLRIIETWGYQNRASGDSIAFHLPSVHLGDYETMLVHVEAPPSDASSPAVPVSVLVRYEDVQGGARSASLRTEIAWSPDRPPFLFPSHPDTAQVVAMLGVAQALQKIGRLDEAAKEWVKLRPRRYTPYGRLAQLYDLKKYDTLVDSLISAEPNELTTAVQFLYRDAVDVTIHARRRIELLNSFTGSDLFSAERKILEKYLSILQRPASLGSGDAVAWSRDPVLSAEVPGVGAEHVLAAMLHELLRWPTAAGEGIHMSAGLTRVGSEEIPSGLERQLEAHLSGAIADVGSRFLGSDGPTALAATARIDLDAETASIGNSQRYLIRAYLLHLYGATHVAMRLLDTKEKRLVAFTTATVAVD